MKKAKCLNCGIDMYVGCDVMCMNCGFAMD